MLAVGMLDRGMRSVVVDIGGFGGSWVVGRAVIGE